MDTNILISIVTVCFNSSQTIKRTIESVLSQSYDNIEYILVDGLSTDETVNLIESYKSRFINRGIVFKFISEPDNGIYDAMNKGIKMAEGVLVGVINSDDWYEKDALERVSRAFKEKPDYDVYHGLIRYVDSNTEYIIGHHSSFLDEGMIEHPGCFVKKGLFNKIGFFDLKYSSAADYEWMLRARKNGASFVQVPFLLSNFRLGGVSGSINAYREDLRIKRDYRLIGVWDMIFLSLLYYLIDIKRFTKNILKKRTIIPIRTN